MSTHKLTTKEIKEHPHVGRYARQREWERAGIRTCPRCGCGIGALEFCVVCDWRDEDEAGDDNERER